VTGRGATARSVKNIYAERTVVQPPAPALSWAWAQGLATAHS